MTKSSYLAVAVMLASGAPVISALYPDPVDIVHSSSTPGSDLASTVRTDAVGNIYVSGIVVMQGTGEQDIATIKYRSDGSQAWFRRYDGLVHGVDEVWPGALQVDQSGNVYVVGTSDGGTTYNDYAIIKYDSNGVTQWVQRYIGPQDGNDDGLAIQVDGSGNVYVTGESYKDGQGLDFATLKYDVDGNLIWERRYNGSNNANDQAVALALDPSGNVFVTGFSQGNGDDYLTIKYSTSGDTLWTRRYHGFVNDRANSLIVDVGGNAYVSGISGELTDIVTIKYDPDGDTAWIRRYNGPAYWSDQISPGALDVDNAGNVYVVGYSSPDGMSFDYVTIKYAPNGDTSWVRRYHGPLPAGSDRGFAVRVAGDGSVVVTGVAQEADGSGSDYTTLKYDTEGHLLWERRYDGPISANDQAMAVSVDFDGFIAVTGSSNGLGTGFDFATIRYAPSGDTTWVRRYHTEACPCDCHTDPYCNDEHNVVDVVLEIETAFRGFTPAADPQVSCPWVPTDVDCTGETDIADVVRMIDVVFRGASPFLRFCTTCSVP